MRPPDPEVERLRAQVVELQRQMSEQAARTNAIVAAVQERAYWLDRWHLDLNALMATRRGAQIRAVLRAVRVPLRRARQVKRKLLG